MASTKLQFGLRFLFLLLTLSAFLIWWFTAPTAIQRLRARDVEVACEGAYQYEQNGDAIIFQPPHAPKETWNNVGLVWFVRESRVENADLSLLQTLPKLKVLGLQSPSLDDRCLDHVLAAPKVKFVALGDSGITDTGLLRLTSLPNLEILDASGAHAVSGDALAEFKRRRPNVTIIRRFHRVPAATDEKVARRVSEEEADTSALGTKFQLPE